MRTPSTSSVRLDSFSPEAVILKEHAQVLRQDNILVEENRSFGDQERVSGRTKNILTRACPDIDFGFQPVAIDNEVRPHLALGRTVRRVDAHVCNEVAAA